MSQTRSLTRGYLAAIGSAILLSTTAVLIRYLTTSFAIPALILAFWRDAFAILLLLPLVFLKGQLSLPGGYKHLPFLVIFGLVFAVFNSFWTLSVALNGATVATVLAYSSVLFTAVLGRLLFREPLDVLMTIAVISGVAGVAIVSGALDAQAWQVNPIGILAGILTGLAYAGYTLMGRSASMRGLKAWPTVLYTFVFATGFLFIINIASGGQLPGTSANLADLFWLGKSVVGWGVLLLLAVGPTVLGFGLYNISLGYLPAGVVNLIATLEPVFTLLFSYLLLRELLTIEQSVGSLLILIGIAIVRLRQRRGDLIADI